MDLLVYERQYLAQGKTLICGIDEAGRGPLAGPVVAAGVLLPLGDEQIIEGVDDSKKLSAKKREMLYDKITVTAIAYHVAVVDNRTVDEINILNATKKAMRECIAHLPAAQAILIDAVKPAEDDRITAIVHGDALSYSIAAASILAKVTRDRLMCAYDALYPQYDFSKHKGYGTAEHIRRLKQYGPCEIHRKTFIKNFFADE